MSLPPENQKPKKQITNIIISQPEPDPGIKSPYHIMAEKLKLNITFLPFIKVEGLSVKDFRKTRVNIPDYTAVILTSRNAVNNYFRLSSELRIKVSQDTKYFCISESIALYLQKFILYRKRKVFFDKNNSLDGLKDMLKKHRKTEKFLFPCTADRKDSMEQYLRDENYNFSPAVMFETVSADLTGVDLTQYDMVVFFSPMGIKSLHDNFPDFVQGDLAIGALGPTTAKAVTDAGLRLDLQAPLPGIPSITMAIEKYIKENT